MKLEYSIFLMVVGLIYALVKQFVPDFPIAQDVLVVAFSWALAKLGVEFVGSPAAALRKLFK